MAGSNHPNHTVATRALHNTCAGETRTPVTPTPWTPDAANEPASAANADTAGAKPPPAQPDPNPANVSGQSTSRRHHGQHRSPDGLIDITVNELCRLFHALILNPARRIADVIAWSIFRRRHQDAAETSHYARQALTGPENDLLLEYY